MSREDRNESNTAIEILMRNTFKQQNDASWSRFSDILIEAQYLEAASSAEVLYYLDKLFQSNLDAEHFDADILGSSIVHQLLGRNDKTIDCGLIRIANKHVVEKLLQRYQDESSLLNLALTSRIALGGNEDNFMHRIPTWLENRLPTILSGSSESQRSSDAEIDLMQTLLTNPRLPNQVTIACLEKEKWFETLSDEAYGMSVFHVLQNERISRAPGDSLYGHDFDQHKIIAACWNLLIKLDANRRNCNILESGMKDGFPKTSISASRLTNICEKWAGNPEPENDAENDMYGFVRQRVASNIISGLTSDCAKYIFESGDSYLIKGFFSGLESLEFGTLTRNFNDFYEKFGKDFLEGCLLNDNTYLKENEKFGRKHKSVIDSISDLSTLPLWDLRNGRHDAILSGSYAEHMWDYRAFETFEPVE